MIINKKFIAIVVVFLLGQIIFSLIYNSQIIDQNKSFHRQMEGKQQLLTNNQKLKTQLANLTSLKTLDPIIKKTNLSPIKKVFKLLLN